MVVRRKVTVASNPQKKRRAAPRKKNAAPRRKAGCSSGKPRQSPKRRNATAAAKTAANPKRRKRTMAKKANPKRRSSASRKRNPSTVRRTRARSTARRRTHGRRRRNPSIGRAGSVASMGLTALVAMVLTRQLPQMALGANNTGWIGYAGNIATAIASALLARRVAGEQGYTAALIGGAAYTVNRVLTEQLSPIGQYLSLTGVGDAQAATSLGTIEDRYYPYPTLTDENGNYLIPPQIAAAPAIPQNAAMAGLSRYAAY